MKYIAIIVCVIWTCAMVDSAVHNIVKTKQCTAVVKPVV